MKWMKIKWLRVKKSNPEVIFYKNSFIEQEFKEIFIGKKFNKIDQENGRNIFTQKYTDLLGVKVQKKNDLVKLCRDGVIPIDHHAFYYNLKVAANKGNDESEEDSE